MLMSRVYAEKIGNTEDVKDVLGRLLAETKDLACWSVKIGAENAVLGERVEREEEKEREGEEGEEREETTEEMIMREVKNMEALLLRFSSLPMDTDGEHGEFDKTLQQIFKNIRDMPPRCERQGRLYGVPSV
jgi:hypothetical protein